MSAAKPNRDGNPEHSVVPSRTDRLTTEIPARSKSAETCGNCRHETIRKADDYGYCFLTLERIERATRSCVHFSHKATQGHVGECEGKTMSKPNSVDAASLHPIVRRFSVGERIRINFFVDRRESGWHYGTVTSEPVNCYGEIAQKVKWDAGYESLTANSLFERA